MKKFLAMLLALVMIMSFAACTNDSDATEDTGKSQSAEPSTDPSTDPSSEPAGEDEVPTVTVMSYEEFMAAEVDAKVCIESYIQANQAWWSDDGQGKVTIYLQDATGAYFAYEVLCSEEDSAKLVPGTKVRITGDKAVWSGEVEIMNGTIEFLEGDTFIAEATDVTALMGTAELEAEMNKLVTIKGLTFKALSYKDSEWDKDIYVTFALGENEYDFCVENYLTAPDTDLYKAVEALKEGDVVNVTGFLYWYEGPNTHITAIEAAQ